MRIGTITFHCAYNFGSALQTYALKKYLTDLGHDGVLLGLLGDGLPGRCRDPGLRRDERGRGCDQ